MIELLQYEFVRRAFLAGTLLGIIAPLVGIFIVVRRLSGLGDTMAHVSLVGIAIALITKTNVLIFTLISTVLAGLGIERLRNFQKAFSESILVLFICSGLAISTLLVSSFKGSVTSLTNYLFGSIVTISNWDVLATLVLAIIVIISVVILYNFFVNICFDEDLAHAQGLKVKFLNYYLIVLAALVVAIGIQVVGVLLISSLLVVPVLSAMQFKASFRNTLLVSIALSVLSIWLGLFTSFYFDLASGPAIVVFNVLGFVLSLIVSKSLIFNH